MTAFSRLVPGVRVKPGNSFFYQHFSLVRPFCDPLYSDDYVKTICSGCCVRILTERATRRAIKQLLLYYPICCHPNVHTVHEKSSGARHKGSRISEKHLSSLLCDYQINKKSFPRACPNYHTVNKVGCIFCENTLHCISREYNRNFVTSEKFENSIPHHRRFCLMEKIFDGINVENSAPNDSLTWTIYFNREYSPQGKLFANRGGI